MRHRVSALIGVVMVAGPLLLAQGPSTVPRTAGGHPDLQGVWNFSTITALERPAEFAGKEFLTDAGPPMLSGPYNNYVQILQNRDHVVILTEMIHDSRIVPLDGRPHLPPAIRKLLGDSRGRWDGNTLVVETTNFSDKTNVRGSGERLRLVERFTRADAGTLLYEFTVDDPASFVKPWTAILPMAKTDDQIYEYACHEGNYAMTGILRGARSGEKDR